MQFPNWLQNLDSSLFKLINKECSNTVFDTLLPFFRNSIFWVPLYLFIITYSFLKLKKEVWLWVFCGIITITFSDQISSGLIKSIFQRTRPCNEPEIMQFLILRVKHCSGGYSFTSSHACNHFAMAYFFSNSFLKFHLGKYISLVFWVWAFAIGFSQIYVGVHYPFDVFMGSILGILIGSIGVYLYKRIIILYKTI